MFRNFEMFVLRDAQSFFQKIFLLALDMIKEQGGISYLPHMYDKTRAGAIPKDDEISKIDIVLLVALWLMLCYGTLFTSFFL